MTKEPTGVASACTVGALHEANVTRVKGLAVMAKAARLAWVARVARVAQQAKVAVREGEAGLLQVVSQSTEVVGRNEHFVCALNVLPADVEVAVARPLVAWVEALSSR